MERVKRGQNWNWTRSCDNSGDSAHLSCPFFFFTPPLFSSPLRCVKWCNVATTGCNMGRVWGLVELLLVPQSPVSGQFTLCICECSCCASINSIVLRESWFSKRLRQIKCLEYVNSWAHALYYTAVHNTVPPSSMKREHLSHITM